MKTVVIYGVKYQIVRGVTEVPDCYYYDKELHDEPLGSKLPQEFCIMDDGTLVGVYSNSKLILIAVLILVVAGLIAGGIVIWNNLHRPKQLGGTMVKTDSFRNDVVLFNAMPQCDGKQVDIRFTNGKVPATISIKGDDIVSQTITVAENESVATIPVKVKDGVAVAEAELTVETENEKHVYPIVVEIPAALNKYGGGAGLAISDEDLITPQDNPFGGEVILHD